MATRSLKSLSIPLSNTKIVEKKLDFLFFVVYHRPPLRVKQDAEKKKLETDYSCSFHPTP